MLFQSLGGQSCPRRGAVGAHRPQDESAAVAIGREPRRREAIDLAREGYEAYRNRPQGQQDEDENDQAPHELRHTLGFSNPDAIERDGGDKLKPLRYII